MTNDLLFIYGSFSEGMVHFNKVANYIIEKKEASVRAAVYQLEVGFPVLLNQEASLVPGIVAKMQDADMLFKLLDEFHGISAADPARSLYWRVLLKANDSVGAEYEVNAYVLNPDKLPRSAVAVVDGNWERAMQECPSVVSTLTERHKGYIKKLAESNRRDTIVYPLDVCRDLERMQIIVDKGRRFALTNLGKEIIRYI